uniref:Uncharacterized protein n=1 Tax=Anguilla anguilla TaxID=7936 RepID=A0A0E9QB14_ANGAN
MYEDRNKRLYAYKSHLCICLHTQTIIITGALYHSAYLYHITTGFICELVI